jgi:hypothetical protein
MTKELIARIEIPNYRRNFKASDAANAKYYEKSGGKKLPKDLCDKHALSVQGLRVPDSSKFEWREFPVIRQGVKKKVDFLVDIATGQRVVANESIAGKPRITNINGQGIYNGVIARNTRNKMMGAIKDQFRQFVMTHPQIKSFPIIIELEVWDVIVDTDFSNGQDWDLGNRVLPYNKAFEDVLKKGTTKHPGCNIIPDDSVWFVTGTAGGLFCPVETTEERKLVYNIYLDRRDIIVNNKQYQQKHDIKI